MSEKLLPELPSIVKEVLEWYASDPTIWVAWNEEGWAQEEAAKKSGHYTYIGEDKRGHNEYVPNGVRAEEALAALIEWEEAAIEQNTREAMHCQNGHGDVCLASQRDGVICAGGECDIDSGVRQNTRAGGEELPREWRSACRMAIEVLETEIDMRVEGGHDKWASNARRSLNTLRKMVATKPATVSDDKPKGNQPIAYAVVNAHGEWVGKPHNTRKLANEAISSYRAPWRYVVVELLPQPKE